MTLLGSTDPTPAYLKYSTKKLSSKSERAETKFIRESGTDTVGPGPNDYIGRRTLQAAKLRVIIHYYFLNKNYKNDSIDPFKI